MKTKKKIKILLIAAMLLIIGISAYSAEIEDVTFEDSIMVDGMTLSLRGVGLFRFLKFIKAYVGALYMPEGVPSKDVLSDTPKHLEVEYFYAIKGEDFGPATNKVLAQNFDDQTLERLKPRIEKHNALYKDVQPGDRYSLTYIPGRGTELALNGSPLGVIEGADFAAALYAMWLGEKPMNESFKQQLLGEP
jgi:hypothetical protein